MNELREYTSDPSLLEIVDELSDQFDLPLQVKFKRGWKGEIEEHVSFLQKRGKIINLLKSKRGGENVNYSM